MSREFLREDTCAAEIKWQDLWAYSYDPVFAVNNMLQVITANPSAEKLARDIAERTALPDILQNIARHLPIGRVLQEMSPVCNITVSMCHSFFVANIVPVNYT